MPSSAGLTAKAFKQILSGPPSPERARALQSLASTLVNDDDAPAQYGALAKALGSSGVLTSIAECLKEPPGQESAVRCAYYAARACKFAASTLAQASAATLLVPLLIAPDDSLQQWAAAAMEPILGGDPYQAAKGIIASGGVFTIVALLSSSSSHVRSHALALMMALCSAVITPARSDEADNLMNKLAEAAIDAGVCRSISPLLRARDETHVTTAVFELIIALSSISDLFLQLLRRQIGGDEYLARELINACSNPLIGHFNRRVLADMCHYVAKKTGADVAEEESFVDIATKALFVAGGLHIGVAALVTETDNLKSESIVSPLLEAAARVGAERRGQDFFPDSRRDDGARIIAAIMTRVPGAAEEIALSEPSCLLSALVSMVAHELASSLDAQRRPRGVAALSAIVLCISAGARNNDARPAVKVAQAGLFELISTRSFLDSRNVAKFSSAPSHAYVASRAAMLVHVSIDAYWRESSDESILILALLAPPHGRSLLRLCNLLDNLVSNELISSDSHAANAPFVESLTTAILLALGSLCGAARPVGRLEHASECQCKIQVSKSHCCCLAITAILSCESVAIRQLEGRRAAVRLLAALLRQDHDRQDYETVAPAFVHAGLVGVTARCLGAEDPAIRADALQAFVAISLYAFSHDRDVIRGVGTLGEALASGSIVSDATAKHTDAGTVPSNVIEALAAGSAKKALRTLDEACHRGGDVACDTVAYSPGCLSALVFVVRAPLLGTCGFGVCCANICLSTIIALATASEERANQLARVGVCDAVPLLLIDIRRSRARISRQLELKSLTALSTLSTYSGPRSILAAANVPLFIMLFLNIARVRNMATFKPATVALSALLYLVQPLDVAAEPRSAIMLTSAAKQTKVMSALVSVVNGSWHPFCQNDSEKDAIVQSTRQIITALADAPNHIDSDTFIKTDVVSSRPDERSLCSTKLLLSVAQNKGSKVTSLQSSTAILLHDSEHRFEQRYSTLLLRFYSEVASGSSVTTGIDDMDAAALVSLITGSVPLHDSEVTTAHILAVDRAILMLRSIMIEDTSGVAATEAIEGGVLARLLVLGPTSPAASSCLVTLCKVGELHRPLLLSAPTPTLTVHFISTIIDMLSAIQQGSTKDSADLKIIQASVDIMNNICSDSDAAVRALATSFAAFGKFSQAVTRLASIAVAEATVDISGDPVVALAGTRVLVYLVAPRIRDSFDNHEYLCGLPNEGVTKALTTSADPDSIQIQSILNMFADACTDQNATNTTYIGFDSLLDSAASSAIAKACPVMLRLLLMSPPGKMRTRVRNAIAAALASSTDAARYLHETGAVETAVKFIVDTRRADGKTGIADIALGLRLLICIVDYGQDRAVRTILAQNDILPALEKQVIHIITMTSIDLVALSALTLLMKLSRPGNDACLYVASKSDLLRALITLAGCGLLLPGHTPSKPGATHVSVPLNGLMTNPMLAKTLSGLSLLSLVHIAAGGVLQSHIISKAQGIFDVAINALKNAKSGPEQLASASLGGSILKARTSTELTSALAKKMVTALGAAFTYVVANIKNDDGSSSLDILPCLLNLIDALSCHQQGAIALRSPELIPTLALLVDMTMERRSDIAEVYIYTGCMQLRIYYRHNRHVPLK